MPESRTIRKFGSLFRGRLYQMLALGFCVLFGLAMIANTQLGGEAWWFWYATFLRNGARLFTDLHLALPPLFVLENAAWMQLFGIKTLVTEIPSVIHAFALGFAIFLILQESDWPDWQKAIILAGSFLLCVYIGAYRFDDFHVLADTLIFLSLATLLWIARAETIGQILRLSAGLGVLSGLAITTRLNDGVALLVAAMLWLPFLARKKKILTVGLLLLAALLTVVVVVKLTGDTVSAYISNGIVGAAASKGVDKASIFQRPWSLFFNALHHIHTARKWLLVWTCAIVAAWALPLHAIGPGGPSTSFPYNSAFRRPVLYLLHPHPLRRQLLGGTFADGLSIDLIVVTNLVALLVVVRYLTFQPWHSAR